MRGSLSLEPTLGNGHTSLSWHCIDALLISLVPQKHNVHLCAYNICIETSLQTLKCAVFFVPAFLHLGPTVFVDVLAVPS